MGCNHLVHLDYQPSVVTGGDTGCLKAGLLTDVSRSLPPQSFHTATLKWQLPLMETDSTSLAILPVLRHPYGEQRIVRRKGLLCCTDVLCTIQEYRTFERPVEISNRFQLFCTVYFLPIRSSLLTQPLTISTLTKSMPTKSLPDRSEVSSSWSIASGSILCL